jgi:hypothetical protein
MQLLLGFAGAAVGAFVPFIGPEIGWLIGSAVGSVIGAAGNNGDQGKKILGPRVENLRVTTSTYGNMIPYGYGTNVVGGNVIWLKGNKLDEHEPTGDGTQFTYSATFALSVADGEIEKILRIKMNGELIYDFTDTAPTQALPIFPRPRIYLGTSTQMPDPDIEADKGVGNTPAYRDQAYLVFVNMPLERFGNGLPVRFEVEVAYKAAPPGDPVLIDERTGSSNSMYLDESTRSWFIIEHFGGDWGNGISRIDMATNTVTQNRIFTGDDVIFSGRMAGSPEGEYLVVQNGLGIDNCEPLFMVDMHTLETVDRYGLSGIFTADDKVAAGAHLVFASNPELGPWGKFFAAMGGSHIWVFSTWTSQNDLLTGKPINIAGRFNLALYEALAHLGPTGSGICGDAEGNFWVVTTDGSTCTLRRYNTDIQITNLGVVQPTVKDTTDWDLTETVAAGDRIMYNPVDHSLVIGTGTNIYKWDIETETFIDSLAIVNNIRQWKTPPQNGLVLLGQYNEVDLTSFGITATYAPVIGISSDSSWDAATNSILTTESDGQYRTYLGRGRPGVTPLDVVVADLCTRAGLESGDIDVTELAPYDVRGYTVNQPGEIRGAIQELARDFFFGCAEQDNKLVFKLRGRAAVAAIPEADLGARTDARKDKDDNEWVNETWLEDLEIPQNFVFTYICQETFYADDTKSEQRTLTPNETTSGNSEIIFRSPIVHTPDEAQQIVERLCYLAYVNRLQQEFTTMPKYIKLDPEDVITFTYQSFEFKVRIVRVDFGDTLKLSTVVEDELSYISNATGAAPDGAPLPTIVTTGAANIFAFDTNYIEDSDINVGGDFDIPGYYVMFGSTTPNWLGAAAYTRDTASAPWTQVGSALKAATWGKAANTLADIPNWASWDYTSTLTVRVPTGILFDPLSSREPTGFTASTQDEVMEDPLLNLIKVGDELLQFVNATNNGDGTFTLDTFLRARRGTSFALGTHNVGDDVVLIERRAMIRLPHNLADIGDYKQFKGVSTNSDIAKAPVKYAQINAAELRPYAPNDVRGARDGGDNLTITWSRCARLYGHDMWVDGTGTIDNPESVEAYEVDVLDTDDTVLRTLTATSDIVGCAYSAADQTTDFGSPQDAVRVRVHQMASYDAVGRGYGRIAYV